MEKYISMQEVNCESPEGFDFGLWFEEVFKQNALKLPDVVSVRAFQSKAFISGRGQFLLLVELETTDIEVSLQSQQHLVSEVGPDFMTFIWRDLVYREVNRLSSREHAEAEESWVNLVETYCANPAREEEYSQWYDDIHFPDILGSPGFVEAKRYVICEPRDGRGRYLSIFDIHTDDIEKTMEIRRQRRLEEAQRSRNSELVRLVWTDVLYKELDG